ncbi:MAG: ABC transporter substrate-binding protein, partial [Spirochaetota bacterium]|nr:ABC transporter substrate-binding protein [Spirochaetota bacterium]
MKIRYLRNVCCISIVCFFFTSFLTINNSLIYSNTVRGVTNNSITFGIIADQTGPTSSAAVPLAKAVKNYTRHVNDQGGINGRKINVILEDSRYSIPAALAAFKKLIFRDQVLGIIGPISMGETKVLYKHVDKHKVPIIP